MNSETAYLFRHALLRDAAYQLQLPGDRARLHRLAFELIESLAGGRAPEPPPPDADLPNLQTHPTDPFSAELADHAKQAADGAADSGLDDARRLYLHRAALFAERRFRPSAAADLWEELSGLSTGNIRAAVLTRAGGNALRLGRTKPAEGWFLEARDLARTVRSRRVEGVATEYLAILARETGRFEEAERLQEEALAIHREVGNRRCEGLALGSLAILNSERRRLAEAERLFGEAVAIARETEDPGAEGIFRGNLATMLRQAGRLDEAEKELATAISIARGIGDRRAEGVALGNLGQVYRDTGRLELAVKTQEQAMAMHVEVGNRRLEAVALGNLATAYDEAGRTAEAVQVCRRALEIFQEVGDRRHVGVALGNLGGFLRRSDSGEPVERLFEEALAIHRETRNRACEGLHLLELSLLRLSQGRVADARGHWQAAAAILREIGAAAKIEAFVDEMREGCARAGVPPFDAATG